VAKSKSEARWGRVSGSHAAVAATAFAVGAAATAGASQLINGDQIKPGSIPLDALSHKAQKALAGKRGPRGLAGAHGAVGAKGATGEEGTTGATGAQGDTGGTGLTGDTGPQGAIGSKLIVADIGAANMGTGSIAQYISPASGAVSDTESDVQVPAPATGTIRSLAVALNTANSFSVLRFDIRDDGTDTGIACLVLNGTTSCADPSDSFAVTAGDELSLRASSGKGSIVTATAGISFELDPS
jgi:hypothetical protein